MEENRRKLAFFALAGVVVLAIMAGYPVMKDKIREYRQKDISLSQEPTYGSVEETQEKNADGGRADVSHKEGDSLPEEQLLKGQQEIWLSALCDNIEVKVPLWLGEGGIGYFFFPGFAREKEILLEDMEGETLWIGDREIKKGDKLFGIQEEEAYQMQLLSKEEETLLQFPVFFLYSSDLPVMFLSTASGSMDGIDEDKNYYENGQVILCDEEGALLYSGEAQQISGRGNSTWGLSKKPYQFKLVDQADFFGFGAAKSWNLLANGYDETRLRNQITLDMARALGMNYVPDGKMVDLYVNNIYYGNYFLTEKIGVGERNVAIRDMEDTLKAIYDAEELDKLEIVENQDQTRKWVSVNYEESDISGGYLFERELPARYQQEISGFVTRQEDYYALKSPSYASQEQVEYIGELMQQFQDAVEEKDGIHPETGKAYSEYIDIDSFVQKYLVEEISKNYDGGVTSSFFYKPQDEVSTKIYAGPVWDYDVAFGNCNLDEIASNPMGITKLDNHVLGTDIFKHLYEKEDFYGKVVELYRDKALPYLEYLLEEGIDQMVLASRQSARLDSIRWEDLENRYQYYESYDNDVRYLKYFIEQRIDFLNQVWLRDQIYHNVTFVTDGQPWQIFCVKDGETGGEEPIPYRYTSASIFIGWESENGVPYDRYKPVYEDMTFYAVWHELQDQDGEMQMDDIP